MIEKAYSTLSDPLRRKHYDNGLAYLRERRKDRKSSFHPKEKRRTVTEEQKKKIWLNRLIRLNEDKAYYQKFVKYRWMSVIMGLLLSGLFLIDDLRGSIGPGEFISEVRLQYPMTQDLKDADYYLVYTPNETYRLHHRMAKELDDGMIMALETTPILGMRPSIWIGVLNGAMVKHPNPVYVMAKSSFILLFLLSMGGLLNQSRSEIMVNLTLLNGFIFLLCGLFLVIKLIP
jgi:hypothetical protein